MFAAKLDGRDLAAEKKDSRRRHANRLTVGVMALVAEDEATKTSKRTKAALAAAKRRGVKLSGDRRAPPAARMRKLSAEVLHRRSVARAADLKPIIDDLQADGITSLSGLQRR